MLSALSALAKPWVRIKKGPPGANPPLPLDDPAYRVMAKSIVDEVGKKEPEMALVQYGKTKVFYRGQQDRILEVWVQP